MTICQSARMLTFLRPIPTGIRPKGTHQSKYIFHTKPHRIKRETEQWLFLHTSVLQHITHTRFPVGKLAAAFRAILCPLHGYILSLRFTARYKKYTQTSSASANAIRAHSSTAQSHTQNTHMPCVTLNKIVAACGGV